MITKRLLQVLLRKGAFLKDLFEFRPGQDCEIYKADIFLMEDNDWVIYIPDIELNQIPIDRALSDWEIEEILPCCYTTNDFLNAANGDLEKAKRIFANCDWQHPTTEALEMEMYDDDESEQYTFSDMILNS